MEDYEYLYLFNSNIIDSIQNSFSNLIEEEKYWFCSKCKNFIFDIKKLKCGCYYCPECIKKIVDKMTNSYFVLNQYEKIHIRKIRCVCGNNMDLLNLIEDYEKSDFKNKEKYIDSMNFRFNNYIKSLCMNCECKFIDYKKINKNFSYNKIKNKLIDNKNENIKEAHALCKKCFDTLNINKINEKVLFCKICCEYHKISEE